MNIIHLDFLYVNRFCLYIKLYKDSKQRETVNNYLKGRKMEISN